MCPVRSVVVIMLVIACGGGRSQPPLVSNRAAASSTPSTFDARYAALRSVAKRVCACADAECVLKTMAEYKTLEVAPPEGEPETKEQIELHGAEAERVMKCADRVAAEGAKP